MEYGFNNISRNVPFNAYGLYSQTNLSEEIVNTDVQSTLIGVGIGSLSVPANAFKVGDSFIAKMCGLISSDNAQSLTISILSNSNVIVALPILNLPNMNNRVWDLIIDFTITNLGGLGVGELKANGSFTYTKPTNDTYHGANFLVTDNTEFDTTILNTLDIVAQWTTASPNNSIQSQNFNLTKIF